MTDTTHHESPGHSPRSETAGIFRILDAEANRAAEGLRVVEDYLRFVLADAHLTRLARQLRHDLTAALAAIEPAARLASRDSQTDVGAMPDSSAEAALSRSALRTDAANVAVASFKRVQQALRSLEEYSKLIQPPAAEIERLRFLAYTLEQATGITADSAARLAGANLQILFDGGGSETEFARLAESLVAVGVPMLQLRDKQLADRLLLARARRLREITRGTTTLFVMNDRPDLAALANADAVHVGQDELGVRDARAIVGPRMLVGVSTHSIEQARQAVLDGANYIGVGPTFPSATKTFESFTGLELLRAVAAEIALPTFAIGGLARENLPLVLAAGMTRVAVSGEVVKSRDPAAAARELMSLLGSTRIAPGGSPRAK